MEALGNFAQRKAGQSSQDDLVFEKGLTAVCQEVESINCRQLVGCEERIGGVPHHRLPLQYLRVRAFLAPPRNCDRAQIAPIPLVQMAA